MKRFIGQRAEDFTIDDIYGNEVKLSDYTGKKIYLGFFRNVNCPFCNLHAHQLSKLREAFEQKGLWMIFLFESNPKIMLKSIFHTDISPIPLIGDPEKRVYNLYGVESSIIKQIRTIFIPGNRKQLKEGKKLNLPEEKDKEATQSLIPADFLIDENFIIQKAHYGDHINDHLNIQIIRQFAGLT